MSQLQSLHLHIQAPVLTVPDLDSPPISLAPCALFPVLSGHYSPTPHLGLEVLLLYPGNPVLPLPFPEHPTLPANILLDLGQGPVGDMGVAICVLLGHLQSRR